MQHSVDDEATDDGTHVCELTTATVGNISSFYYWFNKETVSVEILRLCCH